MCAAIDHVPLFQESKVSIHNTPDPLDVIFDHIHCSAQYTLNGNDPLRVNIPVSVFTSMAASYQSHHFNLIGIFTVSNDYQSYVLDYLGTKVSEGIIRMEYNSHSNVVTFRFLTKYGEKQNRSPLKFRDRPMIVIPHMASDYLIPVSMSPVRTLPISTALDITLDIVSPLVMGECGSSFTFTEVSAKVDIGILSWLTPDGELIRGSAHPCMEMIVGAALEEGIRYCDITKLVNPEGETIYIVL